MDQRRVADQRNIDAPMAIRSGIWAWSPDHGQLCQVIEAHEERSFQEQLKQKAHAYPEMVSLLVIRVEGGSHE